MTRELWPCYQKCKKACRILHQGGAKEVLHRLQARLRFRRYWRQYQAFLRTHRLTVDELGAQRRTEFTFRPCFGVVIPLYNTKQEYLQDLLDSFKAQTYGNFKLFMVDASPTEDGKTILTERMHAETAQDPRIIYQILQSNAGIATNTNQAIALAMQDADVTHIALCDHDDFVEPNAFYEYAKVLNENPHVKIIYSDEDVLRHKDDPQAAYVMKPDFNPFLLESCNYINHLFVCEKSLFEVIKTADGLYEQSDFDGAQDYDLYLRLVEVAQVLDMQLSIQEVPKIQNAIYTSSTIYHVPKVLYHWRANDSSTAQDPHNKLYAFDAGKRALEAHFARMQVAATVEHTETFGTYRVKYALQNEPLVSVVVPNEDQKNIDTIKNGNYPNLEFVSTVKHAQGEILFFLHANTHMLAPKSIAEMIAILMRDQVGAVGAQLLRRSGKLQSAGMIVSGAKGAGNIFRGLHPKFTYANRAACTANYSAVSDVCLMVRKSTYEQVGGLDTSVALSSVDLCLKIRALGQLVVYTPHAKFHAAQDGENSGSPLSSKWPEIYAQGDPYYNPNFALGRLDCSLRG